MFALVQKPLPLAALLAVSLAHSNQALAVVAVRPPIPTISVPRPVINVPRPAVTVNVPKPNVTVTVPKPAPTGHAARTVTRQDSPTIAAPKPGNLASKGTRQDVAATAAHSGSKSLSKPVSKEGVGVIKDCYSDCDPGTTSKPAVVNPAPTCTPAAPCSFHLGNKVPGSCPSGHCTYYFNADNKIVILDPNAGPQIAPDASPKMATDPSKPPATNSPQPTTTDRYNPNDAASAFASNRDRPAVSPVPEITSASNQSPQSNSKRPEEYEERRRKREEAKLHDQNTNLFGAIHNRFDALKINGELPDDQPRPAKPIPSPW